MDTVIETHGLSKAYKGVEVLRPLDLQVARNSIVGFLGPNGAGKSTTIKLLLGLIKPTGGSGRVFGLDIVNDSVSIRERVGYLARAGIRQWPYAVLAPFLINGIGFAVVLLSGLLWGVWHLPLMLFTDSYHSSVNPWTYYPLFLLTIIVASCAVGYTRLRTESVWPAALMRSAANAAWAFYGMYVTPTSPLIEYVTGDAGIVQLVGYALLAFWVVRKLNREQKKPRAPFGPGGLLTV